MQSNCVFKWRHYIYKLEEKTSPWERQNFRVGFGHIINCRLKEQNKILINKFLFYVLVALKVRSSQAKLLIVWFQLFKIYYQQQWFLPYLWSVYICR